MNNRCFSQIRQAIILNLKIFAPCLQVCFSANKHHPDLDCKAKKISLKLETWFLKLSFLHISDLQGTSRPLNPNEKVIN
jgi:hypothetical protein